MRVLEHDQRPSNVENIDLIDELFQLSLAMLGESVARRKRSQTVRNGLVGYGLCRVALDSDRLSVTDRDYWMMIGASILGSSPCSSTAALAAELLQESMVLANPNWQFALERALLRYKPTAKRALKRILALHLTGAEAEHRQRILDSIE